MAEAPPAAALLGDALAPATLVALQRTAGNVSVSRMLASRHAGATCPCGGTIGPDGQCDRCRAQGRTLARQVEAPESPFATLPRSVSTLEQIVDFTPYSVADRLNAIRLIHDQVWVGPLDELMLERIWQSFPNLNAVAAANIDLFRESADRGADLGELPQTEAMRARFRADVLALAEQYLIENRAYVVAQLQLLGAIPRRAGAEPDPPDAELAAIQRDAANVSRAQKAQRALRSLHVGYDLDQYSAVMTTTFDPNSPPAYGPNGREKPPYASWEATNVQYDRLQALIAGIANVNPAIYAVVRDGSVDAAATAQPQQALHTVQKALWAVMSDIDATGPKIGHQVDYRDLRPIHEQLLAGTRGISGEDWTAALARWVADDVVEDHESTEFWKSLGLGSLAAAAFLVASLATAGSATFFIAAGIGTGIGVGQAVNSWDRYFTLAQVARTNVRDDLGLLGAGQASGALVEAVLDTAFAFLDVYGAGSRLARAGGQAGRVLERQGAERAEREIAELARREAAQQAEQHAGRAAGHEVLEEATAGVLHEAPATVGSSRHTLKLIQSADRIRIWLCSDCALLIDRVRDAMKAIPAGQAHTALRMELREIEQTAVRFEERFRGAAVPRIGVERLNRETNALASRLAGLSRTYRDIEALMFFKTFVADAGGAALVVGEQLARRFEHEMGREAFAALMRDIGPKAVKGLSDLPGAEIATLLQRLRAAVPGDAERVLRWLGDTQTGGQAKRLLAELPETVLQKVAGASLRNRITAQELRAVVDRLGGDTVGQLEGALGAAFNGKNLQALARLDFFGFDQALRRLVDAGRGQVARNLRPLANKTVVEIEDELIRQGMRSQGGERGMQIWTHADGSVVRIKTAEKALKGPVTTPHMVREVAERGHRYGPRDIIAKVTKDGTLVPAGTNFARQGLSDWFRTVTGRLPTPGEIELLMRIWGRAGHIPVIR